LVCVGVLAYGGVSSRAQAAPAPWCHGTTFSDQDDDASDLSAAEPERVLEALAKTACSTNPAVDAQRGQIDRAREAWGKKYGLVGADWADMIAYSKINGYTFEADLSTKNLAGLTPIDQFIAIENGLVGHNQTPIADQIYAADALGTHLTQTGRLAFLTKVCFKEPPLFVGDHGLAATWAICQADLDAFDLQKLYAELRSDTAHDPADRMYLRFVAHDAPAQIANVRKREQALLANDAEYKRVFAVAAKAAATWQGAVAKQPDLLQLAQDMDGAVLSHSRRAYAGCAARTEAALEHAVATIPAKAFDRMYDVRDAPDSGFGAKAAAVLANNPLVYLAGTAFALCQPTTGRAAYLTAAFGEMPGFRGPRSAAQTALLTAEFKFDDMSKKKLPVPGTGHRPIGSVVKGANTMTAGGVVKGLKPKKNLVQVNLQKTLIKQEDCVKEHSTHRITRIRSDGTIQYQSICDKWAVVTHDHTWSNFTLAPPTTKWLKRGEMFSANYGRDDGDVIAVWPNKRAKRPSLVLGAKVK
jgi:hypothetical protein